MLICGTALRGWPPWASSGGGGGTAEGRDASSALTAPGDASESSRLASKNRLSQNFLCMTILLLKNSVGGFPHQHCFGKHCADYLPLVLRMTGKYRYTYSMGAASTVMVYSIVTGMPAQLSTVRVTV